MKIRLKLLTILFFLASVFLISCFGPTEKSPEKVKKQELPEKADSLTDKIQDGTQVANDTIKEK